MNQEIFDKYYALYLEAVSYKETICPSSLIKRRYDIYYGSKDTLSLSSESRTYSKKKVTPFRRMIYELIESQVDTSIPLSKVTPRTADNIHLASQAENYLNLKSDELNSEDVNDAVEREVRIQGTVIYQVDWDETIRETPDTYGDLVLSYIRLEDFFPQPHIDNAEDLEYIFIRKTMTVRKVKQVYNKVVAPDNGSLNSVNVVVCWYLDDNNDVSKLVWTETLHEVIYNMPNYFARKHRVCAQCGNDWMAGQKKCPVCGNTTSKYVDEDTFTVPEDLYKLDENSPDARPQLYLKAGTPVPLYRINELPFVIRRNISRAGGGLYGVSDADILEETQDANNKLLNKEADKVMAGGTVITLPSDATIDNASGTIKKIRIRDLRQKNLVSVSNIEGNIQQDDIIQDRMYQIGRMAVGLTDSYQGKRDTTAESGKAKEVSAKQAAGRLESKFINKTTAYSKIYQKMFKFLLAFSDEPRKIISPYVGLRAQEVTFSKYNFIKLDKQQQPYVDDSFIFSTNGSYTLSNKRESLWNETTQSFLAGGFGNPQDSRVILVYWNVMNKYGYPLAASIIEIITSITPVIPPEIEQALAQNPALLQQIINFIQAKAKVNEAEQQADVAKNEQLMAGKNPIQGKADTQQKDATKVNVKPTNTGGEQK